MMACQGALAEHEDGSAALVPKAGAEAAQNPRLQDVWPRACLSCVCPVFWSLGPHLIWTVLDALLLLRYAWLAVDPKEFEDVIGHGFLKTDDVLQMLSGLVAVAWGILIVQLQVNRSMVFDNVCLRSMIEELRGRSEEGAAFDEYFVKHINQITFVIPLIAVPLIAGLEWWFGDFQGLLFKFILPCCLGGWQASVSNLSMRSLAECCRFEVEKYILKLEAKLESGEAIDKNFWHDMLREHRRLDERLEKAIDPRAAGVYFCLLGKLVVFVFGNLVAFKASDTPVQVFCVVGTVLTLAYSMYAFLNGPAEVTTMCLSKKHSVRSIHTAALKFFALDRMDSECHTAHSIFLQYLNSVVIGFELPMVGMVSMESLLTIIKVLVTAIPVLLAYVFHEDDGRGGCGGCGGGS